MVPSNNHVDKEACFVNVDDVLVALGDALFGCWNLSRLLRLVTLPYGSDFVHASYIGSNAEERPRFFMVEIVFFLFKHSISANDVCDIFHLHATLPTIARIHSVVDVIGLGRPSVTRFNSPSVNLSHDFIYCNGLGILLNLSMKLLLILFFV